MEELISVIVPVNNVVKYLDRCVNSLIRQEYKNIEIILIDDGSTDGSAEICDKFASLDSRVKVYHQEYKGVSNARNQGLSMAGGGYIAFLDSDDEAKPNYISKLYSLLLEHDLDIAQCCLIRVKNGVEQNRLEVTNNVQIYNGIDIQMKIFERNRYFYMTLCGKLFKKELFDGLKFPEGRINEDESLIYLLDYRAKKIGVIDDYLYLYHYNSQSITEKKYNIHRLDCFYMMREKFAFYKENGLDAFANKTANEYFSQMSISVLNAKAFSGDYKAIKKKAKQIYVEDRKNILEKAKLTKLRKIFVKLSYLSFGFVTLYGKLLKRYLRRSSNK